MLNIWSKLFAAGAAVVSLSATAGAAVRSQQSSNTVGYAVIDLGMLPGYQNNVPAAVNGQDVIVTNVCCNTDPSPFASAAAMYANGQLTNLGFLPGFPASTVTGVNASALAVGSAIHGASVGYSFPSHTEAVAFTTSGIHILGPLAGYTESAATGVNDAGDIIGYSQSPTNVSVTLYRHGKAIRLGDGWGYGINNSGAAVGTGINHQAALFTLQGTRSLGTFVGPNPFSYGLAINDRGVAVGYSGYAIALWPGVLSHAFMYDGHGLHDLGVPAGTNFVLTQTKASAVNNRNEIVGEYTTGAPGHVGIGAPSAFLYANGKMKALNTLVPGSGWIFASATSINDCGDIVGQGTHHGKEGAFLLIRVHVDPPPTQGSRCLR